MKKLKKLLVAGVVSAALVPSLVTAGLYDPGAVVITATSYTANFVPGTAYFLAAPFNNRYSTTDTTSFVLLSGAAGGPISVHARASSSGTTLGATFMCTISPTSPLYPTAEGLLRSANVGVTILARYNTQVPGVCQLLNVVNSSARIN